MDRTHLGGSLGLIGVALFAGVFTIEGALRPGYDATGMFISELALGPRGWIQISNFVVFGILFLIFASGVAAAFGRTARAGVALLYLVGASFLAAGPFVMDPVTVSPGEMSFASRVHFVAGSGIFLLSPIACFVFFFRFSTTPYWRPLRWWSVVVGLVMAGAVVALALGPTMAPEPPNAFNPWVGLIQRIAIVPFLAWVFAVAWYLRASSMAPSARLEPLP